MPNYPINNRTLGEIFQTLSQADNKAQRIEILKQYQGWHITEIFRLSMDPEVEFLLPPENKLKINRNFLPPGCGATSLWNEMKRFYLFYKGGHPDITNARRIDLFESLVEGMDELDALLTLDIVYKRLKCGVTKRMVNELFPSLLSDYIP